MQDRTLTLPQIQERKKDLEDDIPTYLRNFSEVTGVVITAVNINTTTIGQLGGPENTMINSLEVTTIVRGDRNREATQ